MAGLTALAPSLLASPSQKLADVQSRSTKRASPKTSSVLKPISPLALSRAAPAQPGGGC
ncbi:hypothetical protein LN650_17955 [Klebsiella pneumoniae subsp. pneumoniae]|nr:hypothetical protein [Klebsiella pneumoniae subsp. pneumoniae]